MATKATLENLVIAQKAQLDTLAAQMAALSTNAPVAPAKVAPKPLVTRGYFKREDPTTGKWTTHTMKVTRGGPLKKGHKVDDIFFFAGPPGSKTTRLMVDNVRLEGSEQ